MHVQATKVHTCIGRWQSALSLLQSAEMPLIAVDSPFPCERTCCAAPGGGQFAPEDDADCSAGDLRSGPACSASLSSASPARCCSEGVTFCLLHSSSSRIFSLLFPTACRTHKAKYCDQQWSIVPMHRQVYNKYNKQRRNIPQSYSALKTAPKRGVSPLRGPERGEKGGAAGNAAKRPGRL